MIEAIIVCTVLLIGSGPEQCEIYNLEPQLERNEESKEAFIQITHGHLERGARKKLRAAPYLIK